MNKEQVKGKWTRLRGQVKSAWGGLTHDNTKKVEGTIEKIHGIIQEKIGDTKEVIKTKLARFQMEPRKRS